VCSSQNFPVATSLSVSCYCCTDWPQHTSWSNRLHDISCSVGIILIPITHFVFRLSFWFCTKYIFIFSLSPDATALSLFGFRMKSEEKIDPRVFVISLNVRSDHYNVCVFWHRHISTSQADLICCPSVRVVHGRGQSLCSLPLSCYSAFFYFLIQATDARVHLYAIYRQPVVYGCIFSVQCKSTQDIYNFLLHSPCKSADALSGCSFRFASFRS